MAQQTWVQLLNAGAPWQTTVGTSLTTGTTATISPQSAGGNDFTLPANFFYPGLAIRVTARGFLTTTSTTTTAAWLLSANTTTYTLATTGNLNTGTGAITGIQWELNALIRCTAIGSSGNTLSTQGAVHLPANTSAPTVGTANGIILPMPNASGETATAVNTTIALGMTLRATLGAANATIQCTEFLLESTD